MSVVVRQTCPPYERRCEIECVTLKVTMLSHAEGRTTITVLLDEGLQSERQVSWVHGTDHPRFAFRGEEERDPWGSDPPF